MCDSSLRRRTILARPSHLGWDKANAPVLTVKSGETVEFHPFDASGATSMPRVTR